MREGPTQAASDPARDLSVAIATHVYATGPPQDLMEHLAPRARQVAFIGHPFSYAKDRRAELRVVRSGVVVKEKRGLGLRLPEPLLYALDLWRTLAWGLRVPGRIDLFVGVDPLNAAAGLALRAVGKARRVAFYTIDYVPRRFGNRFANRLYHAVDRFAALRADALWNLSPRMNDVPNRRARRGKGPLTLVVPVGAHVRRVRAPPLPPRAPDLVVYMGHVRRNQGVEHLVRAMPLLRRRVPGARALVLGGGPELDAMRALAESCGVADAIEFRGFVEDHRDIERALLSCAVAVAPYDRDPEHFTWYADPGKLKSYLAAGLPIVLSDVPHNARALEAAGAAVVVEPSAEGVAEGLASLLEDPKRLEAAQAAAWAEGARVDWDVVFQEALARTVEGR